VPGQALVVFAHRLGSSSLLTRGAALQPTACVSKTGRRGPFLSVVCGGNGEGCPTAAPERLFCSAMAQESPFTLLPEELQPIQDDGEECSPAGPQLVRGPDPVKLHCKATKQGAGTGLDTLVHHVCLAAWPPTRRPRRQRASQATHSLPCASQGPLTPSSTDAGMGTARKSGVLSSGRCQKTS